MTVYHNFELIEERTIPEINTHARFFRHQPTGAELLSLENRDENKVFGITLRTPPADSTGIAHIMEHAVLCGSQKYPVREPFVELMKGSLNTFLNAFTFPDKTCYPVASQNLRDFYNLIDVYVDAVFHPLIPDHTLQQEGWHYELDDLDSPLEYKGVVFNEMKGAYSSPDNLLGRYAQQSVFPDNAYRVDSGGDPQQIPNLTYAQFKAFHETLYHPSNARIYFYGDDDPEERLRRMDQYLQGYGRLAVDSQVALQTPFSEPRRMLVPYDAGEEANGKKGMLVLNWLLPDTLDSERTLGLNILAYILIGTSASPLRKALIDSGLGEDLAGGGLDGDLRQMFFSTGLRGVADGTAGQPADYDKVEALILSTLTNLVQDGIDPETVAAALNTVEFRLRENNTGSFPQGLLLMLRSLTTWLYEGNPLAPLAFAAPLEAIKKRLARGERYFEDLLATYFLGNTHRTLVILQPQAGLRERQEAEERAKLDALRASLSPHELEAIVANTRALKLRQETPDSPQALATIPSLSLDDLERTNKLIPLELLQQARTPVLYHDLFTNGILYLDLGLNLHCLPLEYLPYAALFGRLLLEMGAADDDFVRLSQRIGRTTGGIHPSYYITTRQGSAQAVTWLFLRSKATLDHTPDLLGILQDVLISPNLDNPERFRQIVLEEKADLEAALAPAGHRFASTRLRSFFNEAGWVDEQMGGVSQLYFLRDLVNKLDSGHWPAILQVLESIRSLLLNREQMIANVTVDQANWSRFQPELADFLASLPRTDSAPRNWQFTPPDLDQGLAIPATVNFVGKGANLYELGYTLDGSYAVITNYLRATWIWEKVRVQGGAYGGYCIFDQRSGLLSFLSYRDPNLVKTLQIYDQTAQFLRELDSSRLTEEELTKTIIGAIGDMDAYQLPDAKGYASLARYLAGETDEARQRRREEILSTELGDFHAFGEILEGARQRARVVVLGSEQALQEANAQGQPLVIEKVL